ncbi:MAG: helix-turn-helix domain-containing protein [Nitrospirae bacterium]|nr:helix-turn-helix domain-containing protein [Nitrospirota bacterium]
MSRIKSIMRTINEILDKIKEMKKLKKDSELAELLGVKQNTLSTWRIRKTIPYDVFYHFCDKEGLLLNWLLTGEGQYKIYSDAEGVFRAAGEYHVDDPELMIIIDDLIASGAGDRKLMRLVKKFIHIYNEGDRQTRAWVRGVIGEAYDEVKEKKQDVGSSEDEGTEPKSNTG